MDYSAGIAAGPESEDSLFGESPVIIDSRPRPPSKKRSADIRADVKLVLIPVTVTDPLGNSVSGLPSDVFHVSEDGVEQTVARVATQDASVSLGFVFDSSKSMENKLDKSREGIADILRSSTPGDEYFLVQFNDKPTLVSTFTADPRDIENALMSVRPMGWTALLDAVHLAVNHMKRAKNARRALVVLSDGGDNNSRFTKHEIRDLLRESDVTLFAIGIKGPMVTPGAFGLLSDLAEETGGRLFPVRHIKDLPEAVAKLNRALHDQYVLAYYPKNSSRDGKYRRVQVRIATPPAAPPLRASWRAGYYAPF